MIEQHALRTMHVHFDRATGVIVGYSNSSPPIPQPNCDVLFVDDGQMIELGRHKVDIANGVIVEKSAAEIAAANRPKGFEVVGAIARELLTTDAFMVPDRPMSEDRRNAWVRYRRSLRDLSKLTTVAEQIASWPIRPDGFDAIEGLRVRSTPTT